MHDIRVVGLFDAEMAEIPGCDDGAQANHAAAIFFAASRCAVVARCQIMLPASLVWHRNEFGIARNQLEPVLLPVDFGLFDSFT